MININMLISHVKARLGVSHRQIELLDDAIIKCLQEETLNTLSVYNPYYCTVFINLEEYRVMQGMNTFFIPTELGEDFNLMSVEKVMPTNFGASASYMSYLPGGTDLQSLLANLATTKLMNSLGDVAIVPYTFEFNAPNMLRLDNSSQMNNVMLIVRTTHKKDFTTFPFGLLETIKKLALYDVMIDIHSIRKFFSNTQTMFAQINLNIDDLQSAMDKRDELVEKLRNEQLKYATTRKIYQA